MACKSYRDKRSAFKQKMCRLLKVDEGTSIGVIMIDYRSDPALERSLSHLAFSAGSLSLEVIVVENSPTGPPPRVPDALKVRFLRQDHNLGFGRAVNLALSQLQSPYFLLLNPDVNLFPKALSILHRYMETHPEVGVIVPQLLDLQGAVQYSARTFYDFPTILLRRTFLGRLFPAHSVLRRHLMVDWDHASIREIDWALGACMLIRAKAVGKKIFDPRFFLYFEDVDLCMRLKKEGWKVIYHSEARAVHEHRQESRKNMISWANYEHFKSWVRFMVKYKGLSGVG